MNRRYPAAMIWAAIRQHVREYVDVSAHHWLGWSFPPVNRAILDAKWQRDAQAAYCHRCGDSVAAGEATDSGCATCRSGGELAGGIADGVLRLGPYLDPLQTWVHQIKYHGWVEMAEELGRQLARAIHDSQMFDLARTIVVPMPMPWQRRIYRGIDHARVISSGVARELNVPMVAMLAKAHHPPQVSLAPSERKRRGARGMRVRRRVGGWPIHDLQILLVDDVRTTGSTLKAASRLLKALKPQRVVCGVIAVSDSKARRDRNQLRGRPLAGAAR